MNSHAIPVVVHRGTTTEVPFALAGRTVRGRTRLEGFPEIDWLAQARFATFGTKTEKPGYEEFRDDPELMKKAYTEFWVSEEGRAWERKRRNFAMELRKDGSFEILAVPPGEYVFNVTVREKSEGPIPRGKTLGMLKKDVIVPEGSGDLDLGEIALAPR